jgi:plasmid stabilization system protein ParE
MMVVTWKPQAKKRMDQIYSFYAWRNVQVSRKIVSDIQTAVERLVSFPYMAAIEPALSNDALNYTYRSLVVRNIFKLIYRVDEINSKIIIVTIWDCRQDPGKLKEGLEG